jgi:MraZ protein
MEQFLGEFDVPVDEKGRIFVPAELRKKLPPEANETFIVLRGYDRCLTAYPQNIWAETAKKMLRLPQTERKARMIIRGRLSQAAEVKFDRQGRALIPRKLLERVGIKGQMVVIGALDKLEFWNPEDWNVVMKEADEEMENAAEDFDL